MEDIKSWKDKLEKSLILFDKLKKSFHSSAMKNASVKYKQGSFKPSGPNRNTMYLKKQEEAKKLLQRVLDEYEVWEKSQPSGWSDSSPGYNVKILYNKLYNRVNIP
jgi:hypothetical protein